MSGQGRRLGRLAVAGMLMLLPAGAGKSAEQVAAAVDVPLQLDAELTDMYFSDPLHGWAVGAQGVIWHTDDGGGQWQRQFSNTDCRLNSVFFLDAQHGWAAGGRTQPYTQSTTGELLRTRDGGQHWERQARLPLATLNKVRFFNSQQGWAISEPSSLYPSGVLTTDDGGKTWMGVPGAAGHGWLTGEFFDPDTGAVAGRQGGLVAIRRRELSSTNSNSWGLRALRRMQSSDDRAWLVGDGGLILTSADRGQSWQPPAGQLPPQTSDIFDWRAIAAHGEHCWVAGAPGTAVAHTADAGQTWKLHPTGQTLPINGLCFTDERRGWAVGAMGTILATADGGATWQTQASGGKRAALLAIYSQPTDLPVEMFAKVAGNEGYLAVAEILNRTDLIPGDNSADNLPERTSEALAAVGASAANTAWRFPIAQPDLAINAQRLVDGWDRMNDGAGLGRLEAHLVRQIRQWRPDVVVTHASAPRGDDPLGHLINQLVLTAATRAADPEWFAEQIHVGGLRTWKASKVYGSLPAGQFGSLSLAASQLAPRWGKSLAEQAALPAALLSDTPTVRPASLPFQLYANHLPAGQGQGDFFTGLMLQPGGDARRRFTEPPAEGVDFMQRIVQKQRNAQAILERAESVTASGGQLLGQLDDMLAGLDKPTAGTLLFNLGQQYYNTGRWALAAETFDVVVRQHPDHALAPAACLWLIQYWSSGEAARRQQQDPTTAADRAKRAAEYGKLLEARDMLLAGGAAAGFPLAVAHRNLGNPRQAERFYLGWQRSRAADVWRTCAEGERWLNAPVSTPPKATLRCVTAGAKPILDGKLDDSIWAAAPPCELQSILDDDAAWPAKARVAYDGEFLYLAVECHQAPGVEYPQSKESRPRDPKLSAHDRVDFYLDVDRDWATAYRLTVDHRGWTGEDCWRDLTWNPQWFVAAESTDGTWTVEAAIPLSELTSLPVKPQTVWCLGIQRTVPGVGFQSWTPPAAVQVKPEGFGYLLFQ